MVVNRRVASQCLRARERDMLRESTGVKRITLEPAGPSRAKPASRSLRRALF